MQILRPFASRFLGQISKRPSVGPNNGWRSVRNNLSTLANHDNSPSFYPDFHSDRVGAFDTSFTERGEKEPNLTSLLMELPDRVGVLHDALRFFWKYDVNIRRIESRPSKFGKIDFFVDVEGAVSDDGDQRLNNLISTLKDFGVEKLLTLDEKEGRIESKSYAFNTQSLAKDLLSGSN
mmetsp:Transcript_2797/g.7512  ORF Transcript_2797/g.7512 Transcript_2797/m.7512 type:complete len:178 (-) Transcript_2797:123-656(-)